MSQLQELDEIGRCWAVLRTAVSARDAAATEEAMASMKAMHIVVDPRVEEYWRTHLRPRDPEEGRELCDQRPQPVAKSGRTEGGIESV